MSFESIKIFERKYRNWEDSRSSSILIKNNVIKLSSKTLDIRDVDTLKHFFDKNHLNNKQK